MNHKYSTYVLFGIITLAMLAVVTALFTSEDIDEVCAINNQTLQRIDGTWQCANATSTGNINSKTCTSTDKFSSYNNTTGEFTCSTDETLAGGGDGNNYTTEIFVTGGATKNITISRDGMGNISAIFTDNEGTDTDTYLTSVTATNGSIKLFNFSVPGQTPIYVSIDDLDSWANNITNYYTIQQIDDLVPTMLRYYFWDVSSTINTTFAIMNRTQSTVITNKTAISLVDTQPIVYRLSENTNLTGIGGTIHLHTTATKINGTQTLKIKGIISKYHSNGTIVDLAITDTTSNLQTGIMTNISLSANIPKQTLDITDRLLWRLQAVVSGGGTAPSVNITVGGTTQNGLDIPVEVDDIYLTNYYTKTEANEKYSLKTEMNNGTYSTNTTGLVQNWNISGWIKDWAVLNGTGWIINWSGNINTANTSMRDYVNQNITVANNSMRDFVNQNVTTANTSMLNFIQAVTYNNLRPTRNWINYTTSAWNNTGSNLERIISDMNVTLLASSTYIMECNILYLTPAATTGITWNTSFSTGVTTASIVASSGSSATAMEQKPSITTGYIGLNFTGSTGTVTYTNMIINGYIVTGAAAPTLVHRFKSELAAPQYTQVNIGSNCEYKKIA